MDNSTLQEDSPSADSQRRNVPEQDPSAGTHP